MKVPVYFVIPDPNSFPSGGNIYNQNFLFALRKLGATVHALTWDFFKKNPYLSDAVYIFDTLYLPQLTELSKRQSNGRSYLLVHHLKSLFPPEGKSSQTVFLQEEKTVLQWVDGFMTTSAYTTNYLQRNGLSQPIITIPPALTFSVVSSSVRQPAPINALLVANWVKRKGILTFLETLALKVLLLKEQATTIHLVGAQHLEPAYTQQCQKLLTDAQLEEIVRVHGAVPPNRISAFYQQSNLFISTSLMETYGMALQEAKAFGLPILAMRGGNIKQHITEGVNGFIFSEISALVQQLLHLGSHPKTLKRLLDGGQKSLTDNSYSWEVAATKSLHFLQGQ
ncbi:MAG: glycosyltransferase family 4 protein [Bacteroidota bacterium]